MKNKNIIGSDLTIVNQILPHTNKWAWDLFVKSLQNHWVPTEISMFRDIQQWHGDKLSEEEKLLIKRCLGFFAGSESLVANNLLINVFRYVTDAECRQYIGGRQIGEEAIHNMTVVYICDSLNLDCSELYEAYSTIPSIKAKDDFLMTITKDLNRKDFDISAREGKLEVLRNIITYYIVCEGIFFYSAFAALLSFGRRNLIPGICEQIQYTLRDEANHVEFGLNLIKKIHEQEDLFKDDVVEDTLSYIKETAKLEVAFINDVMPSGILGMSKDSLVAYVYYLCNRRCNQLGIPEVFVDNGNPLPWLSEVIDLPKMKNFFESRVTEYAKGSLEDDL